MYNDLPHPDALLPLLASIDTAIRYHAEAGDCTSADALHSKRDDVDRVRCMLAGEDDRLLALLRDESGRFIDALEQASAAR